MVLKAMFGLASANRNNRLIDEFNRILDGVSPERRNCCEMIIGGQHRYILTREPEHIKAILTTKFAEFGKGDRFHYDFYAFLGDSIFTTDAKQWHDSRNLIRPMFVKDRVEDLAIFESRVSLMLSKLPADGVTVDIMRLFYRLTLDITTEFLLGTSVDSLEK
jgi:cytochrome P450